MRTVWVLNGPNLGRLGRRQPEIYGDTTHEQLAELCTQWGVELGLEVSLRQTNHEGEYCEMLHEARDRVDGLILNPGAWTHYSYAIRDALEVCGLPAVEVHISEVDSRDDWRRISVIRDLCVGRVQGEGAEGYRRALQILREALG